MPSETPKEKADPGRKYRLEAQLKEREKEGVHVLASGPAQIHNILPTSENEPPKSFVRSLRSASRFSTVEWVVGAGAIFFFTIMAGLAGKGSPLQSTGQVALVALAPLAAVTFILGWVDRWAPIKTRYKVLALFWGAGVAAGFAGVINAAVFEDLLLSSGNFDHALLTAAVTVAPIGEETFKGIGVVLILWLARNHLFSSLSGMALGGLVGAGFAYLENLDYFLLALSESSASFGVTIFARGVLSPFIHPMATSLLGLVIADAILKQSSWWGWLWRITIGWSGAVAVHVLWNGLAAQGMQWVFWYLFLEVPLFAIWLGFLVVRSGRQPRQIRLGLKSYVETGWITPAELRMVTDRQGRTYARSWAKRIGKPAPKIIRKFNRLCGYLGLDQILLARQGIITERLRYDREYLRELLVLREEILALEEEQKRRSPLATKGMR